MKHGLGFLVAAVLAVLPQTTRAEIIPATRMAEGITITQPQCAAMPTAVWVIVNRQGYCIRYYLSTAGGEGTKPVVFLQGDRLGRYEFKTRRFEKVDPSQDADTEKLQRTAENISKLARAPGIYLGRPGVEGSSGFHGYRKTWLELYIVHAALDAIKLRHGYQGFHLAGQSGGGSLVGGLLILREDIACAVPGAGLLARLDQGKRPERDPMLQYFDPMRESARIAFRTGTRVILITDPEDKTVRAQHQTGFVDALRRAGGRVEQYFVQAVDENRHGVMIYALHAVARCVKGESAEEIRAALGVLQQRHLAAAEERRRKAAGLPQREPQS